MIDLDRGVTNRQHPSGFSVFMYKDAPGVFYSLKGDTVSTTIAAEAGFDTVALLREKQRKDALATALAEINLRFGHMETGTIVHSTPSGFSVVFVGNKAYSIRDGDGAAIGPIVQSFDEAVRIADELSGSEEKKSGTKDGPLLKT